MQLTWILISLIITAAPLITMEQPSREAIILENRLEMVVQYWTVVRQNTREGTRSLIHGRGSGTLEPQKQTQLNPDPDSQALQKNWQFPVTLSITAASKQRTTSMKFKLNDHGHYLIHADPESPLSFLLFKREKPS